MDSDGWIDFELIMERFRLTKEPRIRQAAFRTNVPMLSRMSGRAPKRIVKTLAALVDEGRIELDRRTGALFFASHAA